MALFVMAQVASDVTGGYTPQSGDGSPNIFVLILFSVLLVTFLVIANNIWERWRSNNPTAAEKKAADTFLEELKRMNEGFSKNRDKNNSTNDH